MREKNPDLNSIKDKKKATQEQEKQEAGYQ